MKQLVVFFSILQIIYSAWSLRTECHRFNSKLISNTTCHQELVGRSSISSTTEFYIVPGVELDNIFVEVIAYKKFGTVFQPTFIKWKENFCDIIANKSNSYFAQQMRKGYEGANTNILEPCPMKGRKFIEATQITLPPQIPIGDWKVISNFTTINGREEFIMEFVEFHEVK